jgi:hypothetical protein
MPRGLCHAPTTYQVVMIDILRNFSNKIATVYLNDVCVHNRTMEEHLEHIRCALQRFKEGLALRRKK